MITPTQIRQKAERRYLSVLRSLLAGEPFERVDIPADKSYTKTSMQAFEQEILLLISQSKVKKGTGYTLAFQRVKTKYLGLQDLPTAIYFDSEVDFFRFLGKEKEVAACRQAAQRITAAFPELAPWVLRHPAKVIQHHADWDGLLAVCAYFSATPRPQRYIRELPIGVHTKFIERHTGILRELLDILIAEHIDATATAFEQRFYLKYQEPRIRFRVLDADISAAYFSGLDDLEIPIPQFQSLALPLQRVLIVENKTTLYTTLSLPRQPGTLAIFGSGNAVANLQRTPWLHHVDILYWGDIDVQGFEILSRLRAAFPHTRSLLMDRATFDAYFENDPGTPTTQAHPAYLTPDELALYDLLRTHNWRLEQEKIPWAYMADALASSGWGSDTQTIP